MVIGEVDIGHRLATLHPITQMGLVDFRVTLLLLFLFTKLFMLIREVYIGCRSDTFLPITVVENTVPHRGPLKMLFLGAGEDKLLKTVIEAVAYIHIKIILIILIQACHHNQSFCVHIELLLISMYFTEFHTI